jgi:hypothetical protein
VAAAVVVVAEVVAAEVVTAVVVGLISAWVVEEVVEEVVKDEVVVLLGATVSTSVAGSFLGASTVGRGATAALVWFWMAERVVLTVPVGHWVTVSVTVTTVQSVTKTSFVTTLAQAPAAKAATMTAERILDDRQ